MTAVEVKNLSFSYDNKDNILNNISFQIEKGQYVSIVGHNGSGKSTLAKLLVGLLETKQGEIYINDLRLTNKTIKKIRQIESIVFQNPDNQFIGATVEDDIAFGLENRNFPQPKMIELVKEWASNVGMGDYLNKEPSYLSGGQKQRVAIAGALVLSPEILILDEATSMLDPKGKRNVRELIAKMKENMPFLTIISITHDIEEAYLSDQVIVLNSGEILLNGTPQEVFSHEEQLKNCGLDIPFIMKFKNGLDDLNIKYSSSNDLDEVISSICQSK